MVGQEDEQKLAAPRRNLGVASSERKTSDFSSSEHKAAAHWLSHGCAGDKVLVTLAQVEGGPFAALARTGGKRERRKTACEPATPSAPHASGSRGRSQRATVISASASARSVRFEIALGRAPPPRSS